MAEFPKVTEDVDGAPYKIGQRVQVTFAADDTINRRYLRHIGVIVHFDYECGCGQSYPEDPMIGVRFACGKIDEFWKEELTLLPQTVDGESARKRTSTRSRKGHRTI